jgi:beta-glucosidase
METDGSIMKVQWQNRGLTSSRTIPRAFCLFLLTFFLASAYTQGNAAAENEATLSACATKLISQMTLEEKAAQMQDQSPAVPRLGIPAYGWWNEGLHGVANSGHATNFPQAIGLGATWDTALIHKVAETISIEARAKHSEAIRQGSHARFYGLTFWSPNINLFCNPRWGRGQETYL